MDIIRSNFRSGRLFDAIICDPPYGVRVTSRKQDIQIDHGVDQQEENKDGKRFEHTGSGKGAFDVDAVYFALIELAAKTLRIGGRLVFFFHTDQKGKKEKPDSEAISVLQDVDKVGVFRVVDVASNEFLRKRKRHMITLERI